MFLPGIKIYLLAFIPIFFAIDIIGTVPLFVGLTESLTDRQRVRLLRTAVFTAALSALIFIFLGKLLLRGLGITIDDFKVAGGILLFILSVYLLLPNKSRVSFGHGPDDDIGIFPLAIPLITGPAVLVTSIMLVDTYGLTATLLSLSLNMLLAYGMLRISGRLVQMLGESGVRAFSKITYIFLAAIGVMITREGIQGIILSF